MNSDSTLLPAADEPDFAYRTERLDNAARQPMALPVIEEQALVVREMMEGGRLRILKTV